MKPDVKSLDTIMIGLYLGVPPKSFADRNINSDLIFYGFDQFIFWISVVSI